MSSPSLWWIDWSLHGGPMRKEAALRFLLLFLAASFLLVMLLSGGVDRFLSDRYTMTAIMRTGVPDEEGTGIAAKIAELPSVRDARYRTPEDAWEEFLEAYPGLESLRGAAENPLPGYVEIRLRPGHISEQAIADVRSALEPVSQVEKVLSGGDAMPALLRIKRWANALLWSGFALLCMLFLVILAMQEKARAARLVPDVSFLVDRGVPGERISVRRTAGAFAAGAIATLVAVLVSFSALFLASSRFPLFRSLVGQAQDLLDARGILSACLFLLFATILQGVLSLAGWRAAFTKER